MTFPDQAQCPICRAEISAGMRFCGECGSKLEESAAEKIRSVNFLLAELSRWEAAGVVGPDQASSLREKYERRRDNLRAQLILNGKQGKRQPPEAGKTSARQRPLAQPPPPNFNYQAEQSAPNPQSFFPSPVAPLSTDHPPRRTEERAPRRPLLETLADPHTIRLLLYTGAAMLVVGVVIWLRDVLYLKLQEPIVQAGLLAVGTIAVTVSGWLTILRTRLRLTGRALTLTGSLLVPVNFWFLVRSGLIRDNGRAWVVCAFCTLLYAHTAALLREKLYVYLAGVAAIATTWTLVYRFEREAFGLYALSLMAISLAFLHLSRLFPAGNDDRRDTAEERAPSVAENSSPGWGRLSHELWGPPLVHVGLAGVAMSALFYMPLRFGSSPSLGDGILRLRATEYDPSIAMLLFAAAAYGAWFTGRYILTDRRALLYTLSALALFWTEFLAADGLRLSGQAHLLLLAASALVVSLAARAATEEILVFALHRSSLIVAVVLASAAYPVISVAPAYTLTQSATLFLLAATFAAASAPHLCESVASATLAHASAIFASLAYIIALNSFNLQSETLFYAACTVWPFALYAIARATRRARRETQLSGPFIRVGDAEFVLLLLFAAVIAFVLDQAPEDQLLRVGELRGAMFCALCGAIVYGALRSWRDRSVFGAALMASAVLITVAAVGDALKYLGALPSAWPVASAVIIAAFLLREAAEKLLPAESAQVASDSAGPESRKILPENFAAILSRVAVIRLVADCAVIACASLWLTNALYHLAEGGTSAAVVLFLALLYWAERAARQRQGWLVHLSSIHAGALCFAVLVALRIETEWFATIFVLALFPLFFMLGRTARL
ncbi:MAG TPA: zinc ribbon domain-containing protein, partial [Pyrinomonadaceae bacterium]|nr:zinc ribbon domain-containing protein [Pyrinomonadaceae bacterium]